MGKILLTLLGAALAAASMAGEISGSITYREKIALPSNAVITVRMEDVTVENTAPKMVSELRFAVAGKQVPFNYVLPYVDAAVTKGGRYQVRASIRSGGQLLFASANPTAVISNGMKSANLVLQRASVPQTNQLTGVTWKLIDLNGKPAITGSTSVPNIKFEADGNKLGGFTGVNHFGGSYKLTGGSLSITVGPQTLIGASQELMDQERDFTAALKEVTSYRLLDGRLDLLKGPDVIARFEK